MASPKAQELRMLLGLAIKLRAYLQTTQDYGDSELLLAAALALEARACRLAVETQPTLRLAKVDFVC